MRTLIAVAVTVLLAVVIVWSNSISRFATDATVGKATLGSSLSAVPKAIPTISIWEIHNQAHLEHISFGLNRRDSQWFVNERVYPP